MRFRMKMPLVALQGAVIAFSLACLGLPAVAGPYNDVGIPADSPELRTWASEVVDYSPAPNVTDIAGGINGQSARALGPAGDSFDNTVSLGDLSAQEIADSVPPGSITLRFNNTFHNSDGWDFAVFENAFGFFPPDDDKVFAELAYVEVSSDGATFARFPSVSLTTEQTLFLPDFGDGPLRDFAGIDPSDVYNLAGKHGSLIGTEFDLDDLAATAEVLAGDVDPDAINYVRLIDIPGNGMFLDSDGREILDAWDSTSTDEIFGGTGGLDLDAVGARYAVPEPTGLMLVAIGITALLTRRCVRVRMRE